MSDVSEMRADIEASFASLTGDTGTTDATPPPVVESTPAASAASESVSATPDTTPDPDAASSTIDKPANDGRDERGRFKTKEEKAAREAAQAAATAPPKEGAATVTPKPGEAAGVATATAQVKGPQSWRPEVREKFGALPADVRAEVDRVDREVRKALEESANARHFEKGFQQTISPYIGVLRAEGVTNPLEMVDRLMQTAVALRTAPPAYKAQLVGGLIRQYGVPLAELDSFLAGEQPDPATQRQQYVDPEQIAAQAEQRVMQRIAAGRAQATQAKGRSDVEAFEAKSPEFFEDVREDVADLLTSAARRNVPLTLEEAYNRALWVNPKTSAIMQQRKLAELTGNASASTQRAKAAASSVRGQPVKGIKVSNPSGTMRDDILAAFDRVNGT